MKKQAVIIGAQDAAGRRICADLQRLGWETAGVFVKGQEEGELSFDPKDHESAKNAARRLAEKWDQIDMLILNIDDCDHADAATILDEQDYDELKRTYEYNTVGPLRALNAFLPLLEKGEGKRICVVTTAEGSNSACMETGGFGRHMCRASLNMAMNLIFNGLRPEGYTMRLYCKEIGAPDERVGAYAAEYFTRNRSNEPESYKHSDENRLALRDWHARELPW